MIAVVKVALVGVGTAAGAVIALATHLVAVSDVVWGLLIGAFVVLINLTVPVVMQVWSKRTLDKIAKTASDAATVAGAAAVKADEVAKSAKQAVAAVVAATVPLIQAVGARDEKLDRIEENGRKSLEFSNGAHGASLKLTATFARRMAAMTQLPEDAEAADMAEKMYAAHEDAARAAQPKA